MVNLKQMVTTNESMSPHLADVDSTIALAVDRGSHAANLQPSKSSKHRGFYRFLFIHHIAELSCANLLR